MEGDGFPTGGGETGAHSVSTVSLWWPISRAPGCSRRCGSAAPTNPHGISCVWDLTPKVTAKPKRWPASGLCDGMCSEGRGGPCLGGTCAEPVTSAQTCLKSVVVHTGQHSPSYESWLLLLGAPGPPGTERQPGPGVQEPHPEGDDRSHWPTASRLAFLQSSRKQGHACSPPQANEAGSKGSPAGTEPWMEQALEGFHLCSLSPDCMQTVAPLPPLRPRHRVVRCMLLTVLFT